MHQQQDAFELGGHFVPPVNLAKALLKGLPKR